MMVRFQLLLSVITNQWQCSWIATDAATELITGVWIGAPAYLAWQELMGGEAAKERVTAVPSKSKLPTYFRFGVASAYVLRSVT